MIKKINTIIEECEHCTKCIRECPKEFANITKENENGTLYTDVNHDECISCGKCIQACDKGARVFETKMDKFLRKIKFSSVVIAPSIKTNFKHYKRVLQLLESLGARNIYDSSFGASITTWGYLKYLKESGENSIISQPCPSIVEDILKNKPSLIKKLSPIHSPMSCMGIYVKDIYEDMNNLIGITPCIAKDIEFQYDDIFDFNITFQELMDYIDSNNIILRTYKQREFDGESSTLGSIYPKPGGLKENIEFFLNDMAFVVEKSGKDAINYLEEYERRFNSGESLPTVFDGLACNEGCNKGSSVSLSNNTDTTEIEKEMHRQKDEFSKEHKKTLFKKRYKLFKEFDEILDLNEYMRTYKRVRTKKIKKDSLVIEKGFEKLNKTTEKKRNFNCQKCGYSTCENFALTVAQNNSSVNDCTEYLRESNKKEHELVLKEKELANQKSKDLEKIKNKIEDSKHELVDLIERISNQLEEVGEAQSQSTGDLENLTENLIDINNSIKDVNKLSENMKKDIKKNAEKLKDNKKIAENTNLISLNASIQAAQAGDGAFSVIAEEIRDLALKSQNNSDESISIGEHLKDKIGLITNNISDLKNRADEIEGYSTELSATFEELTAQNEEIFNNLAEIAKNANT